MRSVHFRSGWVLLAIALIAANAKADAPRVVAVWAADPLEVRIAFDQPIAAGVEQSLVGRTIRVDESERTAADRAAPCSTSGAPSPVGPVITGARRQDDGRLVVLTTDPHNRPASYCLPFPPLSWAGAPRTTPGSGFAYDLSGVEASWDNGADDAKPAWTGWWPSLSPEATREATRGSVEHERSLALLTKPGRLTLHAQLALPPGAVKVRFEASQPIIEAAIGAENADLGEDGKGRTAVEIALDAPGEPLYCAIVVRTGHAGKPVSFTATYQYASSSSKAIGHAALLVPWAPSTPIAPPAPPAPPALAGGDAKRGEALFFGETAKCAGCHQMSGKGQKVGPDLTTVFQRNLPEVYRDVAEPSAVIRFEFVPYTVALKDGRVLAGIIRAEGVDAVRVTDTEAKTTVVPRNEIEELRPSATSIMPVGLVGAIGEANMRDLMAFLMKPKP